MAIKMAIYIAGVKEGLGVATIGAGHGGYKKEKREK
jgi:hypothetical protein